jgi:hypothetical protein
VQAEKRSGELTSPSNQTSAAAMLGYPLRRIGFSLALLSR